MSFIRWQLPETVFAIALSTGGLAEVRLPNIVFILIDDMAYADLSGMGNKVV